MPTEHFEYAIVGGGKAGKTLAAKMATAGRRVIMIEKGMIGGTCINVACIPTKTLVKSAKAVELARRASLFGLRLTFDGVDPVGVRGRKRAVVAEMVKRNQGNFDRSGMTLVIGTASFTAPRALRIVMPDGSTREVTADNVFINTGTRPALPVLPGLAESRPLDSESVQELDRLPEHLVILGAGYVGCEFAQMFRRFGSRVTLVEQSAAFLPREDPDVAEQILSIFREDGVDVRLGARVQRVAGRSGESVQIVLETAAGEQRVDGSDLLVALGRAANTAQLNLAAAGVDVDSRGFVKVNDRLETSAECVGARRCQWWSAVHACLARRLPDCVGELVGRQSADNGPADLYVLFIDPELGRIGLTETEARRGGRQVRVAQMPAAAIPRAVTSGETRGFLKVVVDGDTDQILGASILAAEGGEVMAVVQVAMLSRLPYTALRDMIFAHPTMAEGLNDLFARI